MECSARALGRSEPVEGVHARGVEVEAGFAVDNGAWGVDFEGFVFRFSVFHSRTALDSRMRSDCKG